MNSDKTYHQPSEPESGREADHELTVDLWHDEPDPETNPGDAPPLIELKLKQPEAEDPDPETPDDQPLVELHLGESAEELPADQPLREPPVESDSDSIPSPPDELEQRIADLQRQEQDLKQRVAQLQAEADTLQEQLSHTQGAMGRLVQEGLTELEQRKKKLQVTVEQLERRSERIRAEMRTSFAGVSQDLAIRIQGFKDYLVGSLQDLASTAEQLQLVPEPSEMRSTPTRNEGRNNSAEAAVNPRFAEQGFQEQVRQIRRLLDQYRTTPDYYGPAWQLRRTFEPIHAERVSNWFFTQGGRGAVRTMGSRLQNILVASAVISILRSLYGDRIRPLVLANSPERLGEWRRGLQDCLGLTRSDFSPEQGVGLFETPEAISQKADRLVKNGQLPLMIIDESENQVNVAMLQYPLWLAFASDPDAPPMIY